MARKNNFIEQVDNSIGCKIAQMRINNGWSRQELAKMIEVTHQQLQKYEKGTNRISVGRLALIAKAFNKSPAFFYDGFDIVNNEPETHSQRFFLEVSRNFKKIRSVEHQNALKILIKSLVKESA